MVYLLQSAAGVELPLLCEGAPCQTSPSTPPPLPPPPFALASPDRLDFKKTIVLLGFLQKVEKD